MDRAHAHAHRRTFTLLRFHAHVHAQAHAGALHARDMHALGRLADRPVLPSCRPAVLKGSRDGNAEECVGNAKMYSKMRDMSVMLGRRAACLEERRRRQKARLESVSN